MHVFCRTQTKIKLSTKYFYLQLFNTKIFVAIAICLKPFYDQDTQLRVSGQERRAAHKCVIYRNR